ncbi:MAG TPA: phosphoglycerate mutase [Oleiagrimonas sp.]|nr:phosphoglycerate mutase [Oleiagrimonas sp.]
MNTLHALLPSLARFDSLPVMQRMLARGDSLTPGATGEQAISSYFDWPGTTLPVAALVREHLAGDAGDAVWLCADLAHIQPDMTGARILACGSLDVDPAEAEALAKPLRPWFGDSGLRLEITTPARWHLRLPSGAILPAFDSPGDVLGDDLIRHLPEGDAGRRWRQLINETQILLHQHPLNRQRQQQGRMTVNSLWLWGGGSLPMWIKSDLQRVYADDLLPVSLARRAGVEVLPLEAFDDNRRLAGDTLLDLGRSGAPEGCADMLFGMLRQRRIHSLVLHFAGGERWRITRGQRWRFWRRGA